MTLDPNWQEEADRRRPSTLARLAFPLALGAVGLFSVWPWVSAALVPSMDYPAHLALVTVIGQLGEQGIIADKFAWGVFPAPNSLFYLLGAALSTTMDVQTAGRVLFGGAMLLMLVSYAAVLEAFGRSRWLAFLFL